MKHKLYRLHRAVLKTQYFFSAEFLALLLTIVIFTMPADASTRFGQRGLYMKSSLPGATTSYTVTFQYMSPDAVGSVDMLFCMSPIPYEPCVAPQGLDVSQAVLSSQSGESGFVLTRISHNHLVLSRTAAPPTAAVPSSYTFDLVKNPVATDKAFAIRLASYTSTDGTGAQIDFGSIRGQVTSAIMLETQVPPMLIFCAAAEVAEDCTNTSQVNYQDLGQLSADTTLTTQSQMAVGTNATAGFAITAHGTPLAAGTNVIDAPSRPTTSTVGNNQFGINLVANTQPSIGGDPEGPWTNAVPTVDYATPNLYKYSSGDVVASAPNVSLMRKFTVSYIVNSDKNLRAGVYTTTITYIASGRF